MSFSTRAINSHKTSSSSKRYEAAARNLRSPPSPRALLRSRAQGWKISINDILLEQSLAGGAYGNVWLGRWNKIRVAVKMLRFGVYDDEELHAQDLESFEKEVELMREVRHKNIVLFLGAGTTVDRQPFIVTE